MIQFSVERSASFVIWSKNYRKTQIHDNHRKMVQVIMTAKAAK
jgi:hypothetical protein